MAHRILLAIIIILQFEKSVKACVHGEIRDIPVGRRRDVRYCYQGQWRSLCLDGNWNQETANVVCKQLGYSGTGALESSLCQSPDPIGYLTAVQCTGTESTLIECTSTTNTECSTTCSGIDDGRRHSAVTCQPADCANGEMRMVGGSTNREGRVEVCVNGRWGTVCNSSQEGIAGAVCSQLGFATEGATTNNSFGTGFSPTTLCTLQSETTLNCNELMETSCDQSTHLGVVCRKYEQLYKELLDENSRTVAQFNTKYNRTVEALGGVVGVLLTVLVVLIIGWSLSCVALVKRHSKANTVPEVSLLTADLRKNPAYDAPNNMRGNESDGNNDIHTNRNLAYDTTNQGKNIVYQEIS